MPGDRRASCLPLKTEMTRPATLRVRGPGDLSDSQSDLPLVEATAAGRLPRSLGRAASRWIRGGHRAWGAWAEASSIRRQLHQQAEGDRVARSRHSSYRMLANVSTMAGNMLAGRSAQTISIGMAGERCVESQVCVGNVVSPRGLILTGYDGDDIARLEFARRVAPHVSDEYHESLW